VTVTLGGVERRGADGAEGSTPRGGHDVTHLNTRERRVGDSRRGTLSGLSQLVGRVADTIGDKGGSPIPPDARRAPGGASGGRAVQGGPRGDGRKRPISVPRGPERPFGAHGAVVRGHASLRADPNALRGDDAGTLPAASRAPGGEQDEHVNATVIVFGIGGGGRLRLRSQLHSVPKEPRRQATQDKLPQDLSPDGAPAGSVSGPARAPPPNSGGGRTLVGHRCSGSCPHSRRGTAPSENPAQDVERHKGEITRTPGSQGAKRTKTPELTQTQR